MADLSCIGPYPSIRSTTDSIADLFVGSKSVWLKVPKKILTFSFVLFFLSTGHLSLAAELPPADTQTPFHATHYPFLPSLTEDHEPELCSIALSRSKQRFFSPDINFPPPIEKEDGAERIPWNVFQEGPYGFRVDLDLEGDGKLHPVIGRVFHGPGIMIAHRHRVFQSAKALEKEVAATCF